MKYSNEKWDLLRVCKDWNKVMMKWLTREVMLDLNFRRKLGRSQVLIPLHLIPFSSLLFSFFSLLPLTGISDEV